MNRAGNTAPGKTIPRAAAALDAAGRALAGRQARGPRRADPGAQITDNPIAGTPPTLDALRGSVDASALRLRFQAAVVPGEARTAASIRAALEQVRVEALGARRFPGCGINLHAYYATLDAGPTALVAKAQRAAGASPAWWASPLARQLAQGLRRRTDPLANDSTATPTHPATQPLAQRAAPYLDRLAHVLDDAPQFARITTDLLVALAPQGWRVAGPADTTTTTDGNNTEIALAGVDAEDATDAVRSDGAAVPDATAASDTTGDLPVTAQLAGNALASSVRGSASPADAAGFSYRVYTTAHDEILANTGLGTPALLAGLRATLDARIAALDAPWARLARLLQRRVLARRNWWWRFDQESGLIDAARLTRVVTDPGHALVYKEEQPSAFRDTVVSLLLDCSGSMRGEPIALAAASADLLARALERCGVAVEVLGYTTRNWRGGTARQDWLAAGKPRLPGRLADLRHIVFKSADTPWRRARLSIAALLRPDLLRENVDGEALLWAERRLLARPEARRILIVVSDGAPAEDATHSVNPPGYLHEHLRAVAGRIEAQGRIELRAIGIGYNVGQFYRRAVTIRHAGELGGTLIDQLTSLLDGPGSREGRAVRPLRHTHRAAHAAAGLAALR